MPIQQCQTRIKCCGHSCGFQPVARDSAALFEVLARCEPRSSTLAGDHFYRLTLSVVDDDRHFAAEAESTRVCDAESQDGGSGSIRRIATLLENLNASSNRFRAPCTHSALASGAFRAGQRVISKNN